MRRPWGFSLIELLIAVGLLAVVSFAALAHLMSGWRQTELNRDRVFAYERAESMLEELRAFAEVGETQDAANLDQFDDGTSHSFTLSTLHKPAPDEAELVLPDAPVSGNTTREGRWRYARRITVRQFPGLDTRDLRIVTVRMFVNDGPTAPGTEIAQMSSVIRTVADAQPATQVYDVYLLAVENVPGWWVYMDTIKPFVEASIQDLQARNPGLRLRTHWITKLAYGRNPQYTPYFNDAAPSTDPIPNVYFYPSLMPSGSAAMRYYVPENVRARINVDGEVRNGWDDDANPLPYTLADQYNHAMRLADEEALFDARVAAGLEREDEPTWRLLLERMNTEPNRYRNAILVNLHGELLPLPPLRNFSDAAREPSSRPGIRAVTHPEKLRFTRDPAGTSSEDVRLRVYTYKTAPASGLERLTAPVIVEIPGLDLTANVNGTGGGATTLEVRRIAGGLDLSPLDGTRDPYTTDLAPVVVGSGPRTPAYPGEMYARVRYATPPGGGPGTTIVELHSSPLMCPLVTASGTSRGLDAAKRLYGMEYIPCPTETAGNFTANLVAAGTGEKNTARWVITIPRVMLGAADRRVDVVTRIGRGDGGDDAPDSGAFSTGIMYPPASRDQPENVSRTSTWWAASATAVPATERWQFQGDPRHCPYADLKAGGSSFQNGYNWYFDDLQEGSNNALSRWPGFDASRIKNDGSATNDGWRGKLEVDVPRLFRVLRDGLANSEALYTTLTGWSYYYVGLGNEIGYDAANGFASSIPVSGQPFGASGTGYEQSILASGGTWGSGVKYVRSNAGGTYWWGMSWLGELYPDSAYDTHWRVPRYEYSDTLPVPSPPYPAPKGNLPAGTASSEFRRAARGTINVNLPFGTVLRPADRNTNREGCTSLFNIGTSASTFHHQGRDNTFGNLTAAGQEVSADFHFPLPGSARVSRPFGLSLSGDGTVGDEFGFTTDFRRYSSSILKTYYTHSGGATGSALVELRPPTGSRSAYVLVNGIDRTTESGSAFVARYGLLTLMHGFLSAGDPSAARSIAMRPRIEITSPTAVTELTDPPEITITWRTQWLRWDGSPYVNGFAYSVAPPESDVEYVLLYSRDNGRTWLNVIDDSVATPGEWPASSGLRVSDQNDPGDEAYVWTTPSGLLPEGSYLLRVEAYRVGASLHYSYHQEKVYVNR